MLFSPCLHLLIKFKSRNDPGLKKCYINIKKECYIWEHERKDCQFLVSDHLRKNNFCLNLGLFL